MSQTNITRELIVDFLNNKVSGELAEHLTCLIEYEDSVRFWYLFEKSRMELASIDPNPASFSFRVDIAEVINNNLELKDYVLSRLKKSQGKVFERDIRPSGWGPARGWSLFEESSKDSEEGFLSTYSFCEDVDIVDVIRTAPGLANHILSKRSEVSEFDARIQEVEILKKQLEQKSRLTDELIYKNSFSAHTVVKEFEEKGPAIMNLVENSKKYETVSSIKVLKPVMLVAAVIVGFVFAYAFLHNLLDKSVSTTDDLFAEYYEPYDTDRIHLLYSANLNKAKKCYKKGDFNTALMLLEGVPASLNMEVEKELFYGLTLIEHERYDEAIERFLKLLNMQDKSYNTVVLSWYTGLCYLKLGNTAQAKIYLKRVANKKAYNYKQATTMLKKLNNI